MIVFFVMGDYADFQLNASMVRNLFHFKEGGAGEQQNPADAHDDQVMAGKGSIEREVQQRGKLEYTWCENLTARLL